MDRNSDNAAQLNASSAAASQATGEAQEDFARFAEISNGEVRADPEAEEWKAERAAEAAERASAALTQVRLAALEGALRLNNQMHVEPGAIVGSAKQFEAFLKGE